MAFRRFKSAWRHRDADGRHIVYPMGWAGDLDAKTAGEADKAGATIVPEVKAAPTKPKDDDKK